MAYTFFTYPNDTSNNPNNLPVNLSLLRNKHQLNSWIALGTVFIVAKSGYNEIKKIEIRNMVDSLLTTFHKFMDNASSKYFIPNWSLFSSQIIHGVSYSTTPALYVIKLLDILLGGVPLTYQRFTGDLEKGLDALEYLPVWSYKTTSSYPNGVWVCTRKKVAYWYSCIVDFCNMTKIWFNDSLCTSFEMDLIKATNLGQMLWDNKCFLSQNQQQTQTVANTQNTKKTGSNTTGAPKNNYKSLGGQSQNIINLDGTPGQKYNPTAQGVFCIEADKVASNIPNVFIKPLDSKSNTSNGANLFMGSGNGYTDCRLYFDDFNDARIVEAAAINKFGTIYNNIHIARAKTDPNGYFRVWVDADGTKISGLIKAIKMNEELLEEIKETTTEKNWLNKKQDLIESLANAPDQISDITVYDEAFRKCYS